MEVEIASLCEQILLTEGEKTGIKISDGEVSKGREVGERSLVGRIGGEKRVNKEAFKMVLSRLWRVVGSVVFKEIEENVWIFEFSDIEDKRRIMASRPWSFDRQILILNKFNGIIPPS